MPGFIRKHSNHEAGYAFPASRYHDPRGGRPSALERNILRYRAVEATLYLFYAEEVRDFMLTQVHGVAIKDPAASLWEPSEERRLKRVLFDLLMDAETRRKLSIEDAEALRLMFAGERQQGKKRKVAFTHAIKIGMFTEAEADELNKLLDYRNDIAHRISLVMSDVSRSYLASDFVSFTPPKYKGNAIDRLRAYHGSLWERVRGRLHQFTLSIDGMLFEFARHAYENELKRLERLIKKQICRERHRINAINAELDLQGTELVGDLDPRFPTNHRPDRTYGDNYVPPTGHLTKRGVEICYRLFDLGKSPMVVAYLMGMTLRSAERRRRAWLKSGALERTRAQVDRYDPATFRKLPPT
jgi:hypothetical protein